MAKRNPNPYTPASEQERLLAIDLITQIRIHLTTPQGTMMPVELEEFADSISVNCEREVARKNNTAYVCRIGDHYSHTDGETTKDELIGELTDAISTIHETDEEGGEVLKVEGAIWVRKRVPEEDECYIHRIRRKKLEKVCTFVKTTDCEDNRKVSEAKAIKCMRGIAKRYGYKVEQVDQEG